MIIKEFFSTRKDGINLYKIYSDEGLLIKQIETEIIYKEAIDIENASYTYEEVIDSPEYSNEISAEEFMALVEEAL